MKKMLSILFLVNINLWAFNTNGYQEITEIKIWPASVDVYVPSVSECSKTDHKNRYLLKDDSYNEKYISFALSAFTANKKVSLYYACNTQGYPVIKGIRIKK